MSVVLRGGAQYTRFTLYASALRVYLDPLMTRDIRDNVHIKITKNSKRIQKRCDLLSITLHTAYPPLNVIAFQIGAGTNLSNDASTIALHFIVSTIREASKSSYMESSRDTTMTILG